MNDLTQKSKIVNSKFHILLISISAIAVLAIIHFYVKYETLLGNTELSEESASEIAANLGAQGDYFGGLLNPVFGFLSLMALLYTIVLQSRELSLSRQELEETRKEVARSADAQELSQKALNQQAFESTFFNMLNLRAEVVRNLELSVSTSRFVKGKVETSRGNAVFSQVLTSLCEDISQTPAGSLKVSDRFRKFQMQQSEVLGSYFNNFKQIMLFINGYLDLDDQSKRKYTDILKGQLSSDELILLFLHGLDRSSYDQKQFVALATKYELFEFINFEHNDVNEKFKHMRDSVTNKGKIVFPTLKGKFTFDHLWLAEYSNFDQSGFVLNSAFGSNPGFSFYKYKVKPIESKLDAIKQKATKGTTQVSG